MWLAASLIYGGGLRLHECVELRVDLNFDRGELTIRDGKGGKGRVTMRPAALQNRCPGRARVFRMQQVAAAFEALSISSRRGAGGEGNTQRGLLSASCYADPHIRAVPGPCPAPKSWMAKAFLSIAAVCRRRYTAATVEVSIYRVLPTTCWADRRGFKGGVSGQILKSTDG